MTSNVLQCNAVSVSTQPPSTRIAIRGGCASLSVSTPYVLGLLVAGLVEDNCWMYCFTSCETGELGALLGYLA